MSEEVQTSGVGGEPPEGGTTCGGGRTASGFDLAGYFKALGVTEHPVAPLPDLATVNGLVGTPAGRAALAGLLKQREELIAAMKEDPLQYGFRPWYWERAAALLRAENELLILGGNRSAKTEFAAFYAMQDLVTRPRREWAFLHSSADSCKRQQMPRLYRYLPPAWRNIGKQGKTTYVSYTEKNGFADGIFILPNGSRGYFFNYMQLVTVLEGYELDGAWGDELIPLEFVEALRYRVMQKRGKLILTFTPVSGYTPTVGKFLAGAKLLDSRPSPLLSERVNVKDCALGQMPFVLKTSGGKAAGQTGAAHVICFFTEWNPFNPYEELVKKLAGEPERTVMMRAYGWAEKAGGVAFPRFGAVHIVKRVKSGELGVENGGNGEAARLGYLAPARPWENLYAGFLPRKGTNFRVVDPAPLKNWVIHWYRCDELGRSFLYREWPDWGTHGAWAVAGKKADGDEGPAQRMEFGKGIRDYKRIMLEAEGWRWLEQEGRWDSTHAETILDSVMDSRGGGAAVPSDTEATSILQLLNEAQVDEKGRIVGPPLYFREARGVRIGEGLQQLNERLAYRVEEPVSPLNCPKFYVVEDCEQAIYAFREYTGLDGEKGNLKDVVDPARYFVTTPGLEYVAETALGSVGGGGY